MAIERRKDNRNRVLKEGEYQRANGTYEFRWRDKRGVRRYIYGKTLTELREKEAVSLKNALDGIKTPKKNLTINNLFDCWVQLKRGLKPNTFQNYKYMYTQFVRPSFGERRIADLKRSDIRAFYNHLIDERHLKPSTVDGIHSVLHQILDLAVEDEYLRFNPADHALKELKKARNWENVHKRALTKEQQERFEQFLAKNGPYHKWYPVFVTMLWTGMRVGEVTGLRWCDVDMKNDSISVNHTLVYYDKGGDEGCSFGINTPKTAAGVRNIPMLPRVKEALLMEKTLQDEFDIHCSARVDGYTDFIFVNRFGGLQHQGTLNKALRRIIRDCNFESIDKNGDKAVILPPFSNHSLRHTFTTRMCEAGVNVKAMQDILGHKDAETTLQIYAEATRDLKKIEMKNLEAFFTEH